MSGLTLVTAPGGEPVTLAEALLHLRLAATGHPDESMVEIYRVAARQAVENQLNGWLLVEQTWDFTLDCFPATIVLPLGPVQSVTSITYLDTAGASQTLSASLYRVDTKGRVTRVTPAYGQVWPSTYAVVGGITVRFVVGYETDGGSPATYGANVPAALKAAILLTLGDLYEHRQTMVAGAQINALPRGAYDLLAPYQLPLVGG